MLFEWDRAKAQQNLSKHGISFETAKLLWRDEDRIEIMAPHPVEERWIIIGRVSGKVWTAIYTWRNNAIRIISVRRSRKEEVSLYEDKETG